MTNAYSHAGHSNDVRQPAAWLTGSEAVIHLAGLELLDIEIGLAIAEQMEVEEDPEATSQ